MKSFVLAFVFFATASPLLGQGSVYVANQGNFGDGNGSVTWNSSGVVMNDFVSNIGSIIQSVYVDDASLYVLANTGDRIDVFDAVSGDQTGQIPNIVSPRYMTAAGGRGYVTNLYKDNFTGGTVTVLDLLNQTVVTTIDVGDNPEGLALGDSVLYVANNGFGSGTTVSVIDTATDTVIDTLDVGCDGPRFVFVDEQDELVVFCTGKTVYNDDFTEVIEQTNGQIVFLDAESGEVSARLPVGRQLGSSGPGQDAVYNMEDEEAYVVGDSLIYLIDTLGNTLIDSLSISGADAIGALSYEVASDLFYIGRIPAVDGFTTNGYVGLYDMTGTEVDRFEAGIAPAYIWIEEALPVATEPVDFDVPDRFALQPNYPNPFNPSTTFSFSLPQSGPVTLKVYTLLGEEIATVVNETLSAGTYRTSWNADGLSSGVYVYRLQSGAYAQTRTLTLLK